jgi:hypothetical protein
MSTQTNDTIAYISELLSQKRADIQKDEAELAEVMEMVAALEARLEKKRQEEGLLAKAEDLLLRSTQDGVVKSTSEPEVEKAPTEVETAPTEVDPPPPVPAKRRGRKKGSKNKPKTKAEPKASKGKPEARQITKGARPPLKKSMWEILGADKVMSAPEMLDALKERGYLPQSKDPKTVISWTFSSCKDAFIRVTHGKYRSNPGWVPRSSQAPSLSRDEVDSELAGMGLSPENVKRGVENPFQI